MARKLPLIRRWQEPHKPLPKRVIQAPQPKRSLWFFWKRADAPAPEASQPFDFCASVQRLVTDIAERCPDFRHLQVPRILVTVTQARGHHTHGLQARVTPLRFARGELVRKRRGVPYHIQRYFHGEQEYLYLLTFCLPRFQDQDFDQKFITVFHELYHISPQFDGDLRRHHGRYQFHSHSKCDYDKRMVAYAREYLAGKPDATLHAFLRMDFGQLQERHGAVAGVVVPRPKMIPLVGVHAPSP